MENSIQTMLQTVANFETEKEKTTKKRKEVTVGEEEVLESLKQHMQNTGQTCLGLGKGKYVILEPHKVKPSLKPDMAGFLFQEFMKLKGASIVSPTVKQEFITFVENAMIKMTEINDYKITITRKRPAETFTLNT